jgi:peptide/nickel transport system permease protein
MIRFLLWRLLMAVPVLLLVTLGVFLLLDLAPGDAATTIAGENATPELIAKIRADLNLDEPLWQRYFSFLTGIFHGDLGTSQVSGQPVTEALMQRMSPTVSLVVLAMFFACVIGVLAGALAALNRNGWVDRVVNAGAALAMALPQFVIGILLVIVFALTLQWFPATGYGDISEGIVPWFQFSFLPALTLAGIPAALVARQTRGALTDALEEDYVRTARAKGLRRRTVVGKHAAKNAAIPVITVLGILMGSLIGGAVVVERVFGVHGIGSLAVDAVLARDLPVLQGVVLVTAVVVILLNIVVDVAYGYLNPQVRSR